MPLIIYRNGNENNEKFIRKYINYVNKKKYHLGVGGDSSIWWILVRLCVSYTSKFKSNLNLLPSHFLPGMLGHVPPPPAHRLHTHTGRPPRCSQCPVPQFWNLHDPMQAAWAIFAPSPPQSSMRAQLVNRILSERTMESERISSSKRAVKITIDFNINIFNIFYLIWKIKKKFPEMKELCSFLSLPRMWIVNFFRKFFPPPFLFRTKMRKRKIKFEGWRWK